MSEVVIEFKNVTKRYKLFKNEKRRLLYTLYKKIKYQALPFPELRRIQTSINDWKRQKNKSGFTKYQLTC